jgi:glycosyltransferase involved in cell wall biosynthesis
MRIGYDVRPFLKEETGVGVYFKNLLFELSRLDAENEYFLFSASWKDRFPAEKIPPFKHLAFRDARWPVRAVNFFWYDVGWPRVDSVFRVNLDLTHSPVPLILPTHGKKVVTVCDLFFMEAPELADRQARRHFLKKTGAALGKADGIVTISEYVKAALCERFSVDERKIRVTYLGLSPVYLEGQKEQGGGAPADADRAFGLPGEFLLFVGATELRKNLSRLLEALALVHQRRVNVPLVIVGRQGGGHGHLLDRIRALRLGNAVKFLGYLPDRDLQRLYRTASALVFPSLGEGFGLPLLEAMASGLPAAAAGVSALPEIGGDAALYFDPKNPEDIAEKIIRILEDEELRQSLRSRGIERARAFRWEKTAEETLGFYRLVWEAR